MITGRCACNKVCYEYRGKPLFQVICCCEDCQRASGSSHVPVMGANKAEFTVQGSTKTHISFGGSGKRAVRHFCPDCGSLLFGTPEAADEMVTIYAGSLDNKEIFSPTSVIFSRSKVHWEVFHSGINQFDSLPDG